jgi:phosphatidylglycerol:prolipoprotein diacylglycerol transferase
VVAAVALVGARAHFVLTQWGRFAAEPLTALAVWSGGLHAPGGIVAAMVAAPAVLRRYGIPWRRYLDATLPAAGVSLAIVRVGCLLNGCCFGTLCAWPWGIRFPHASYVFLVHAEAGLVAPDASASAPVHPLQLYFAAAALLMAASGWWAARHKRYDGEVALVSLFVFAATSAVLELFRADYPGRVYWGALPQLEWTTLAMTVATAGALAVLGYPRRAGAPVQTA